MSPLNIPGWRGFPLRQRLRSLRRLPVRLHNDAICVAVAEHWRGAGVGVDNMLGMVVSTGVGGGLVLGGRVVDGNTRQCWPRRPHRCRSGRGRCARAAVGVVWKAIARGPAIAAWAVEHGWRPHGDVTARALADDARGGNAVAIAAFDRAGRAVGIAIASAAALLDVTLVVVGGGLAQAGDLLFAPMRAAIADHAKVDFLRDLTVVPATLGNDAGLVGAAALVLAATVTGRRPDYWSSSSAEPIDGRRRDTRCRCGRPLAGRRGRD